LYQAQHDGEGNRLVCGILRLFEHWNCRLADRFIATSATQRRVQIERCGAPPHCCHLVRNVPSERFLELIEPLPVLRGTGRHIIGYMGIIGIQDRVDMMLEALRVLKDELGRTDFLGVIVGSGAALNDLKRLAREMDLDEYVHFAGFCVGDDLLRHVASFDIGVVPDPSNPYNNSCAMLKLMEYMAMAKPVVGFELAENRITAGEAAFLVQDNDVAELARQLARLLDDPALRQRMGQLGQKRVREHLVWEHQQQELINAYEQLFSPHDKSKEAVVPEEHHESTVVPAVDQERVLV
jgi:glycosyltransferase involved in cell wall biosynthesis